MLLLLGALRKEEEDSLGNSEGLQRLGGGTSSKLPLIIVP